jgi:hypothetical protein
LYVLTGRTLQKFKEMIFCKVMAARPDASECHAEKWPDAMKHATGQQGKVVLTRRNRERRQGGAGKILLEHGDRI